MKGLELVALGFAIAEVDHEVREEGGNNRGKRVSRYLKNCDPPINVAAPWCAAWVQYVTDLAARFLGWTNPLDEVRREALVADYVEWAEKRGSPVRRPRPGDLVAFQFGGKRWDHIGIVLSAPDATGWFETIEGNTGSGSDRDGDGVFRVRRHAGGLKYPVRFIRWAA